MRIEFNAHTPVVNFITLWRHQHVLPDNIVHDERILLQYPQYGIQRQGIHVPTFDM